MAKRSVVIMKVFGGTASVQLAHSIGHFLGTPDLSVEQYIFPDGERRVRITEDVRDEKATIVQSAYPPVDTNYMELFFLIDALKRSGAEFVTAVVPYFGYQRQDHIFRDGEAVSLEVVIKILESLGISRLISVDMHSVKIPDLFTIPVMHLSAIPLFASTIRDQGLNMQDTILVSPDLGGIARIKKLSEELGNMPFVALEKQRDVNNGSVTITGIEEGSLLGKKRAIMVDDMISSGNTILLGAEFLAKQGIDEITVFATHPVFSEDAHEKLQKSVVTEVFVTDSVVIPVEKQFAKLKILSLAPLIAEALRE